MSFNVILQVHDLKAKIVLCSLEFTYDINFILLKTVVTQVKPARLDTFCLHPFPWILLV